MLSVVACKPTMHCDRAAELQREQFETRRGNAGVARASSVRASRRREDPASPACARRAQTR